jgi:Ni/Co efflux regulator RcnB
MARAMSGSAPFSGIPKGRIKDAIEEQRRPSMFLHCGRDKRRRRHRIAAPTENLGGSMKRLLSAVLIGFVFLSPMAVTAKNKHHDRHYDRHHDHDYDYDRYHHRGDHDDYDDHRGYRRYEGHHRHDYRRGVVYVERRVYVDDYRHYDLAPPPHGHRWVRSPDGRYILIAVASGIIADILLHH